MSQTYVVLGKDQGRSGPFSIGHVKRSMSDKKVFQNGHVVPDISKTKLVVLDELMKKGVTKDGPTTDDTVNVFILET